MWGFGNCEKGEKLEMYLIRWSFSGGGGLYTAWVPLLVCVGAGWFCFVRLWMDVMDWYGRAGI